MPAIAGERMWLRSATDEGRSLRAMILDRKTGEMLKDIELIRLKSAGALHAKNSLASPTPLLEDDH